MASVHKVRLALVMKVLHKTFVSFIVEDDFRDIFLLLSVLLLKNIVGVCLGSLYKGFRENLVF